MIYEEYLYKLKGSKLTEKDLRELFERERLRDEKYHALLKENEAMREKHRWHYPSKGELPDKPEILGNAIVPNVIVCDYSNEIYRGYYLENNLFGFIVGTSLRIEIIRAWQYIEPPKEDLC